MVNVFGFLLTRFFFPLFLDCAMSGKTSLKQV